MPRKPETVIKEPPNASAPGDSFILYLATAADEIPAWGTDPITRDQKLRQFWPTENILAGSIFSTSSRYAGFQWNLKGPVRQVNIVKRIFDNSEHTKGWIALNLKILIDLFTQDNGAFVEIVRTSNDVTAPVIQLNHLDASRCVRTGKRATPVIYYDRNFVPHLMQWYQVMTLEEMPSPVETYYDMQYCAVTRMLRAAQILRDISQYKREKVGGRFNRAIHLVGGVQQNVISKALTEQNISADARGQLRYIQPLVVSSIDPTAHVSLETIELASLPDGFNEETTMKWYVNQLALAFGGDYQDFAPLPAGNLGTSEQSETLHLKSRGKGPRLFMKLMERKLNSQGIMPSSVVFSYGEQDIAETLEDAQLKKLRAEERQIRIASGEITPQIARQLAVDSGDLDERFLVQLGEEDVTADARVSE